MHTFRNFAIFHILLDRITHFVSNISRTQQILAKGKTSMVDMQGNDFKQQLEITAKFFFIQVVKMGTIFPLHLVNTHSGAN